MSNHPDYEAIRTAIAANDGRVDDVPLPRDPAQVAMCTELLMGDLVNREAMMTVANEHVASIMESAQLPLMLAINPRATFAALWTEAFLSGVIFQRNGGHTETDPMAELADGDH